MENASPQKLVVVGRYASEMPARIAALMLEANGVPVQVMADTAGGMLPSMALVWPVRLLVLAEDESLARELLASPDEPVEEPGDEPVDDPDEPFDPR
jgi:hypothetical protein